MTVLFIVASLPIAFAETTPGKASSMVMTSDGHMARKEAEIKTVLERLQAKKINFTDLSEGNFGTRGDGKTHEWL